MTIHFCNNARRLCDGRSTTTGAIKFKSYKANPHWYEEDLAKGKFIYATAEDLVTCVDCLKARHAYHLAATERLTVRLNPRSEACGP